MQKALNFSKGDKNLIWQRFVQPLGGTKPELMQFIEVCETFGLNPLLSDIVFQRYQTKNGPRTNFIVTRDGWLRYAMRQPDYVGAPIANVVKEGDDFEFIPSEGDVQHRFGKKRGKILGAYAIMHHKRFRPVSVFVDFDEYFKANASSQKAKGGSRVWDDMPSAMITKVAEVFVLRRQFPLTGIHAAEEMGIDDIPLPTPTTPVRQNETQQKTASTSKPNDVEQKKEEKSKKQKVEPEKQEQPQTNETIATAVSEQDQAEKTIETPKGKEYILENFESGTSPSGVPFAKLTVVDQVSDEKKLVLAKGQEKIDLTQLIPEEQPFHMKTNEENGFLFLESINGEKKL